MSLPSVIQYGAISELFRQTIREWQNTAEGKQPAGFPVTGRPAHQSENSGKPEKILHLCLPLVLSPSAENALALLSFRSRDSGKLIVVGVREERLAPPEFWRRLAETKAE